MSNHDIVFSSMHPNMASMTSTASIQTLACQRHAYTILKASGDDIRPYLQSQITQDIKKLTPQSPIYCTVLSPQGKIVSDMHIIDTGHELILIAPTSHALMLVERLRRFALGHAIRLGIVDTLALLSIQGEQSQQIQATIQQPVEASINMPEAAEQGVWLIMQTTDIQDALNGIDASCSEETMENACIIRGTPRFGRDWDTSIHPMNANLIEMGGVSFEKGCYVGQEVTSRMQWRGGVKKKLYHVQLSGLPTTLPCPIQTTVTIGSLSSAATDSQGQTWGIAHLPIEVVEKQAPLSLQTGEIIHVIEACHA